MLMYNHGKYLPTKATTQNIKSCWLCKIHFLSLWSFNGTNVNLNVFLGTEKESSALPSFSSYRPPLLWSLYHPVGPGPPKVGTPLWFVQERWSPVALTAWSLSPGTGPQPEQAWGWTGEPWLPPWQGAERRYGYVTFFFFFFRSGTADLMLWNTVTVIWCECMRLPRGQTCCISFPCGVTLNTFISSPDAV